MLRFRFPIVIIDEDYRSENTSGLGIRALAQAIEKEGFEVLGATSYGDLSQFAQQQSRASAFILSIDDEEFTPGPELDPAVLNLRKFIQEIRFKNADIPIYVYGETRTSQHIPNDILRELHGFIHMFEDTPEFVARHIIREAKSYLDGLAPPFFKALIDYAQDGSYSWHCPGHSGGVAFLKSPVGQMFHQFFGENMLRADVCNAVEELGQLLDHTGPVFASEKNAARIFNADHCFFVTNGTSTSNKMVWHHTVAPGDVVVVDRNCHKSILHSIIMTGAVPVFLRPTRNHYGIIGPIMMIECRIDLWQLRSTTTTSPGATVWCQTILLLVLVPLVTKKQWSALKMRAALRSLCATGPVWSSSWPSSSTELHTSARSMFSPKNWWNIWPTGLLRKATPPEWPGQCHEYEPSSA